MVAIHRKFQSRAGFSVHCDTARPTGRTSPVGFNPVLGFLSTATRLVCDGTRRSGVFQSRAGFSVHCDSARAVRAVPAARSFQSRAGFSVHCDGLLLMHLLLPNQCFNPVLGFLSTATTTITHCSGTSASLFQSRAGFSVHCDTSRRRSCRRRRCVSIPCWVFCPLRPSKHSSSSPTSMFQSRAGFSVHCDATLRTANELSRVRFNPVLGFLSTATGRTVLSRDNDLQMFQSRAGFSVHCDRRPLETSAVGRSVSIPCWVFCPLRPAGESWAIAGPVFQSRAGFSVHCDRTRNRRVVGVDRFQSRAGFSVHCDTAARPPSRSARPFQSRAGFSVHCDLIAVCSSSPG